MHYLPLLSLAVFALLAYVIHRQLGQRRLIAALAAPFSCLLSWVALHYSVSNPIFATPDPQQAFASVEYLMEDTSEYYWLARYMAWYFGTLPGLLIYTAAWILGGRDYRRSQDAKSSNESSSPTTA